MTANQSSEFSFTNKYKMEIQYTYSPLKGSMARDTRGIQKIQYKQQPKKKENNSQITYKMKREHT